MAEQYPRKFELDLPYREVEKEDGWIVREYILPEVDSRPMTEGRCDG